MRRADHTPRAERTRLRILEAAAQHFAERGFEGARLEDIAESIGLRGPALFYHFRDKRDLYRAVLEHLFGGLLDRLEQQLAGSAPLPERLEAGISAWVRFVGERPAVARILLREGARVAPELRGDIARLAAPFLALIHRVFDEGQRTGHFRMAPIDPLHFVSAITGATVFFVAAIPSLLPDLPFDPLSPEHLEAHRREVLTIARRLLGLGAPRLIRGRVNRPGGTKS